MRALYERIKEARTELHLSRQQVAFREKARKFEGLESLEGDFYTRFKPKIKDLGL